MESLKSSSTRHKSFVTNQFLGNVLQFSRLLRQLGIPVSSRQIYTLFDGLLLIDLTNCQDFFHTVRAFLVYDVGFYNLFAQAFDIFWTQRFQFSAEFVSAEINKIISESNSDSVENSDTRINKQTGRFVDLTDSETTRDRQPSLITGATYSPFEILGRRDIDKFTHEEIEAGQSILRAINSRVDQLKSRRYLHAPKQSSQLDYRRSVRSSLKHGGELVELSWNKKKLKTRPVVLICDVSGSMERYTRLFLHFMHAWVQQNHRVEAFVFGTRLTRITPALQRREVDVVLKEVADLVFDWEGGTRIGESLRTFNFRWSRRILRRGALVVILSDGWDRGDIPLLEREIGRLKRSAWKLIWINPLLDTPGYQPLVRGMQVALPYLDDFLPFQNLKNHNRRLNSRNSSPVAGGN